MVDYAHEYLVNCPCCGDATLVRVNPHRLPLTRTDAYPTDVTIVTGHCKCSMTTEEHEELDSEARERYNTDHG